MTGILYFSSTGNSLDIAQKIKKAIGGDIRYIPNYQNNGSEFSKIIIVSPIYSFGLPKHVFELLPKLDKNIPLTIVLNYGGMVGGADYFIYNYCKTLGLNIKSLHTIKMPENFTLVFTVPSFYLKSTLKAAPKSIEKVIDAIKNNRFSIPKKKKTKEEQYLKNKGNWNLIGRDFHTSDACTKCGKCIAVCPVGNIELNNGKILFGDKCVACLGCYHRCPHKAIEYKNKKKSFRYINPNINESDIGKDL